MKKSILTPFFICGAVLVLLGAASYVTHWLFSAYIVFFGAILIAIAQILTPLKKKNSTINRLRIQQIIGAFCLILTGVFMHYGHGNEWIACLTIAAVLELYTAFRIPQEESKED
ncbi:MAG: hypothetical protein WCR45_04580 [Bacteroidaceae bacterium]